MDFIKLSRGLRVMETWRKCLLFSILYISSWDLWNYFCTEPELSVIVVTKQLRCSNRLLVSLHYICVVCLLGHAVWNMLIQKCKGLKNVMAAVVFIGHTLMQYGRGHTWIGSGHPKKVQYPRASAFPGPSYDWWHQFKMCFGDVSDWKSCLLCINALTYIYAPSKAICLKYIPCPYLVKGERQVIGSSVKGGPVHLNLSSGLNSSPSLKMNFIYWIR